MPVISARRADIRETIASARVVDRRAAERPARPARTGRVLGARLGGAGVHRADGTARDGDAGDRRRREHDRLRGARRRPRGGDAVGRGSRADHGGVRAAGDLDRPAPVPDRLLRRRPAHVGATPARPRAGRRVARLSLPDPRLVVPRPAREDRRADAAGRRLHAAGGGGRRPPARLGGVVARAAGQLPHGRRAQAGRRGARVGVEGRAHRRADELPVSPSGPPRRRGRPPALLQHPGRPEDGRAAPSLARPLRRGGGLPFGAPMTPDLAWTDEALADLGKEFGDVYGGRTVLVTGADGFMGSHLTDALCHLGANVIAFVRATSSGALNNIWHLRDRLTVKFADLTDKTSVDYLVRELTSAPDRPYVFHLGAQAHVGESWHRPYETMMANTVGTLNLLQSIV